MIPSEVYAIACILDPNWSIIAGLDSWTNEQKRTLNNAWTIYRWLTSDVTKDRINRHLREAGQREKVLHANDVLAAIFCDCDGDMDPPKDAA